LLTSVERIGARAGVGRVQIILADEWLRSADESVSEKSVRPLPELSSPLRRREPAREHAAAPRTEEGGPRYSRQATELYAATTPLRWWISQYVLDLPRAITRSGS